MALIAFKTLVAVDLCMYLAEVDPGKLEGTNYFFAMTLIYGGASFAKACYQSALKRTWFATLLLKKLVARNIDVQKVFAGTSQLAVEVTMGRFSACTTAVANAKRGEWSWKDEELSLSVSADYAKIQLCRIDEPGVARSVRSVKRTQLASAKLVTAGLKLEEEHGLLVRCGRGGELLLDVRMVRNEPITPLAITVALLKPFIDCPPVQVFCCPCYICYQGWRLLGKIFGRKRSSKRDTSKSDKLLRKEKPAPPWSLSGHSWRLILLAVVWAYTFLVTLHFVVLYYNGKARDQRKLRHAANLVIHAKIFSYCFAEPLSLALTWLTMRFFCWWTLPKMVNSDDPHYASARRFPGPDATIRPQKPGQYMPP